MATRYVKPSTIETAVAGWLIGNYFLLYTALAVLAATQPVLPPWLFY